MLSAMTCSAIWSPSGTPISAARPRFRSSSSSWDDEIALPVFVGAMFDFHWNDHAGQIAKIRTASGMPDV